MVVLFQTKAILPDTSERSVAKLPSCVAHSVMLSLVEVVREIRMRLRSGVAITTTIATMTMTTSRQMGMLEAWVVHFGPSQHRTHDFRVSNTRIQIIFSWPSMRKLGQTPSILFNLYISPLDSRTVAIISPTTEGSTSVVISPI